MLSSHRDALDRLTGSPLERETVDGTDVDASSAASPDPASPSGPPPLGHRLPGCRGSRGTLDPSLARRLFVSRQRLAEELPAAGPGPEAIMDVATDLAGLRRPDQRGRPQPPAGPVEPPRRLRPRRPGDAALARAAPVRVLDARGRDRLHQGLPDPLAADAPPPRTAPPTTGGCGPGWPPTSRCAARSCAGPAPAGPSRPAPSRTGPAPPGSRAAGRRPQRRPHARRPLDPGPHHGRRLPGPAAGLGPAERWFPPAGPDPPPARARGRPAGRPAQPPRPRGGHGPRHRSATSTAGRYPAWPPPWPAWSAPAGSSASAWPPTAPNGPAPGTSTPTTCRSWSASRPATGGRGRPCSPLRQPVHRPPADRAAVRVPLPHGDLRPQGRPPVRLLRPSDSARRPARRPGRPGQRTAAAAAWSSTPFTPSPAPPPRRARPWPPPWPTWPPSWAPTGSSIRQPPPKVWRGAFA